MICGLSEPISSVVPVKGIFWSPLFYADLSIAELSVEAQGVLAPFPAWLVRAHENRQKSFLAGRVAAKRLFDTFGLAATIEVEESGALRVQNRLGETDLEWKLSISHTDDLAVAAFSACPVGIDVEKISGRAARPLERLSSKEEEASFRQFWRELEAPTALWCGKEAFAKMLGRGVWKMKNLRLTCGPNGKFEAFDGSSIGVSGIGSLQRLENFYVALVAPVELPCYRIQAGF